MFFYPACSPSPPFLFPAFFFAAKPFLNSRSRTWASLSLGRSAKKYKSASFKISTNNSLKFPGWGKTNSPAKPVSHSHAIFVSKFSIFSLQNFLSFMRQRSGYVKLPLCLSLPVISPFFHQSTSLSPLAVTCFPSHSYFLSPLFLTNSFSNPPRSIPSPPLFVLPPSCCCPSCWGAAGFVATEQYRLCASSPCCLPSPPLGSD